MMSKRVLKRTFNSSISQQESSSRRYLESGKLKLERSKEYLRQLVQEFSRWHSDQRYSLKKARKNSYRKKTCWRWSAQMNIENTYKKWLFWRGNLIITSKAVNPPPYAKANASIYPVQDSPVWTIQSLWVFGMPPHSRSGPSYPLVPVSEVYLRAQETLGWRTVDLQKESPKTKWKYPE